MTPLSLRKIPPALVTAASLVAAISSSVAQSAGAIAGDYECAYGCRVTDAAPSVEIDGGAANCMNELGGIYRGRVLANNTIYCFNKVGTLLNDGMTIQWADGVIWKRHRAPSH